MPKDSIELEGESKFRSRAKYGGALSPTDSSPDSSVVGSSVAGSSVAGSPPRPSPALYRKNWPLLDDMERPPTPAKSQHKKKPSYSIFPGEEDLRLPATVYSLDKSGAPIAGSRPPLPSFLPPFRPFANDDESRGSTATLQIGMRFSSAPAAEAAAARPSTPVSGANRSTLLNAIDDMLRDTRAAQALSQPGQPSQRTPLSRNETSYYSISSSMNASSATPAARSVESDRMNDGQRRVETPNGAGDYAWLDMSKVPEQSDASTVSTATTTSNASRTRAKRVSGAYLSRSESLRRQAENNRLELANLERSGSGASTTRLRPAYPNPKTPDGAEAPRQFV